MSESTSESEDYECMCGRIGVCDEFKCNSKGIWICRGCGLHEDEDYYHYPARAYREFVLCLNCVTKYQKCDVCKQMVNKVDCVSNLPQKHFLAEKYYCNKCANTN